eukprot:Awhi_evm1s1757
MIWPFDRNFHGKPQIPEAPYSIHEYLAFLVTPKVGDVVGLGVSRSCCGACNMCANGKTNLCPKKALMFAQGEKGCFSK